MTSPTTSSTADVPVRVRSVATALPPHEVSQEDAIAAARLVFSDLSDASFGRLVPMFEHVQVDRRHVCMPTSWYLEGHDFSERNACFQEWATKLSVDAAARAMAEAGAEPDDIGAIIFVSTTGLATPSLDVRLIAELGLPSRHLHRESMFGRGCAGGVVGLAQAADRARLLDDRAVLLVVAELCSLTFRRRDASVANVVSTALFADGVAAVVLARSDDPSCPAVVGHDGVTWPDTEELMGWDFSGDGLTVQLSKSIPSLVRREFRATFEDACRRFDIDPAAVQHHLVHPGSAVVLDAVEDALTLPSGRLELSRAVLAGHGNMSAATVLFMLERFLAERRGRPGELAVVSAMGPGFSADHLLLRC